MAKVLIPLATGFEEVEAFTLVDVLRRADLEVFTATLHEKVLEGAHGIKVESDIFLSDAKADMYDAIILPGGLLGSEHLVKSQMVQTLIKEFDAHKKLIGAICAAPWALSEAGVLKKAYTCYPSFEKVVGKDGYIEDKDVVLDDNIMTSRGPATAMKFALEVIRYLVSDERYEEIKSELLL